MMAVGGKNKIPLLLLAGEEVEVGTVAFTLEHPPAFVHVRRHVEIILCVAEDAGLAVLGTETELIAAQVEVDRHVQDLRPGDGIGHLAPGRSRRRYCPEAVVLPIGGRDHRIDLQAVAYRGNRVGGFYSAHLYPQRLREIVVAVV